MAKTELLTANVTSPGRTMAEANLILRGTVGSKTHGLNLPGTDDTDIMGIYIEPPQNIIGFKYREHVVFRTQPEGVPSGPGDIDTALYGLRKYVGLALDGNPTVLVMLFSSVASLDIIEEPGMQLRDRAPLIVSRRAGRAFLGYLVAQKQRLLGERGGRAVRKPENPHFNEAVGFDCKYAMHMLRLGFQGIELLETGRISLPMDEGRDLCMAVRRGEVPLDEVLTQNGLLETRLERLLTESPLQEQPEFDAVEEWMIQTYQKWWEFH